jgi:hypothetical protein
MVAISGILDLSWLASVLALVASVRAKRETDEYQALEDRIRRPLKFAILHPLRAVSRWLR